MGSISPRKGADFLKSVHKVCKMHCYNRAIRIWLGLFLQVGLEQGGFLMRKIITFNDLLGGLMGAIGYGIGYAIPEMLGLHWILCLLICMAIGDQMDAFTQGLLKREDVRTNPQKRKMVIFGCLVVFAVCGVFSELLLAHSLFEDVQDQVLWVIVLPIGSVLLSALKRNVQAWQLRRRFKDETEGFQTEEQDRVYMQKLNKRNQKLNTAPEKNAVKTRTGIYVGAKDGNVLCWRGIPYAKAPVGALRWKAPQPLEDSTEVWEAKYFGPSCIQEENAAFSLQDHQQSEDCLYLNVWQGKEAKEKCPVLVHIHGGDFSYGGSANPLNYGAHFVEANPKAVFVSINYRLGLLGFADFSQVPGGEAYPDAANLGLLDQLQALRWIKENIAAFGGDPDNVTVMGDSAGAQSIVLLCASGKAEGLFRRSFLISLPTFFYHRESRDAQQIGRLIMELGGCRNMDELLTLDGEQLKAIHTLVNYRNLFPLPTLDGSFLPKDPIGALKNCSMPVVIGLSSNESSTWFMDERPEKAERNLAGLLHSVPALFAPEQEAALKALLAQKHQPGRMLSDGERSVFEDLFHRISVQMVSGALKDKSPVYGFLWDVRTPVQRFGANGMSCLCTVLGNAKAAERIGYLNDADAQEIMQTMLMKFMTDQPLSTFAQELHGLDAIEWKPYNENGQALAVRTEQIRCEPNLFHTINPEVEQILQLRG